jgi:flagellar motility protein MotE (MotC chaperone)
MSKLLEIAAFSLGGLSIFAVCFLGFAMASGVPLHDVAVVGKMFPSPEEAGEPSTAVEVPEPAASDQEVIRSSMGVLGTWNLPSPFDREELVQLSGELKAKIHMLEAREAALDQREREVEEELALLDERFKAIDELRLRLEAKDAELTLRERQVSKSEEDELASEQQRLADLAELVGGLDGDEDKVAFLSEFPAEEAAAILRQMNAQDAAALLNGLRNAPGVGDWTAILQAWSEMGSEDG